MRSRALEKLRSIAAGLPESRLSVAKPSADKPMDAILIFNYRGNMTGVEWDSVIIEVDSDAGKRKIMYRSTLADPIHRDVPVNPQNAGMPPRENESYEREILMRGRKPIKIPRGKEDK